MAKLYVTFTNFEEIKKAVVAAIEARIRELQEIHGLSDDVVQSGIQLAADKLLEEAGALQKIPVGGWKLQARESTQEVPFTTGNEAFDAFLATL